MQILTLWLYTGQIQGRRERGGVFTVARSTLPALKATVLKDFISYLFELDIYKYIDHSKSNNTFRYNGREVSFIPTDDEHKLRGRESDYFWLNECTDTSFEVFNQIIIRNKKSVYLDYNPSGRPWVRTEIEEKRLPQRGDVYLDVSTYKDNPFLGAELVREIMALRLTDESLFKIYTLGQWVELKGLIYPKFELIKVMPDVYSFEGYGLDFGFNDPSVLVRVLIQDKSIFIDCLVHESGLLNDELAAKIAEHDPRAVYCDPSSPERRAELRRRGINARPARAGKDSIRQGINFVKQHNIFITERSVKAIAEFRRYKWQEQNGVLLEKPAETGHDHTSDAVRYAVTKALGSRMRLL